MDQRSCSTPGCDKPYRARGLCSTHYNKANTKPVTTTCAACGDPVVKTNQRARRRYRSVCSTACRAYLQNGPLISLVPITHPSRVRECAVPGDHPSRVPLSCAVPEQHASRRRRLPGFHAGLCKECGRGFIVASEYVGTAIRYCSTTCQRRTLKRARRAREAGASGSFTWDDFTKLTLRLGNICAYCGGDNNGHPFEPDHVMPISRHGHNGLTNILPACRVCNSSKSDRLPSEWVALCHSRGLTVDLTRFDHLTAHSFPTAAGNAA